MPSQSSTLVFFSPTGTTKRILKAVAQGMGFESPALIDLTAPAGRLQHVDLHDGVVIIGMPVYEETVPPIVMDALQALKGRGNPAVLVAVYGNIGYGLALKQLNEMAGASGLRPVAAAAFIGEHSFSSGETPVASGRPDESDMKRAYDFGLAVKRKIDEPTPSGSSLDLPGRLPLTARILQKGSAKLFTHDPTVNRAACNRCGACAKLCPAGAIDAATLDIDSKACIRCFCCVRRCPKKARRIVYKKKLLVKTMLRIQGGRRKEPVVFL